MSGGVSRVSGFFPKRKNKMCVWGKMAIRQFRGESRHATRLSGVVCPPSASLGARPGRSAHSMK